MLQITNILELKPNQLSGGQQQRVSLGRALIRDPAVFILDEVMSHLDAHLKFQMLFELKKIHQENLVLLSENYNEFLKKDRSLYEFSRKQIDLFFK